MVARSEADERTVRTALRRTSCRNLVRPYKLFEQNRYGFAVATLNVPDEGQGFRCGFVRCRECGYRFVAVWPNGLKMVPCMFCENDMVWTK